MRKSCMSVHPNLLDAPLFCDLPDSFVISDESHASSRQPYYVDYVPIYLSRKTLLLLVQTSFPVAIIFPFSASLHSVVLLESLLILTFPFISYRLHRPELAGANLRLRARHLPLRDHGGLNGECLPQEMTLIRYLLLYLEVLD